MSALNKSASVVFRQFNASKRSFHSTSLKGFQTLHGGVCKCGTCTSFFVKEAKQASQNQNSFSTSAELKDRHVAKLLSNNKKWVDTVNAQDPSFFPTLGKGQKPKYLYFGCSDSRVPANQILGLGPGEVFVHRNIGNQVPGNDLNALSVLEYAVGHLGVTDIIVTGHYGCGAVIAASSRQDLGTLENWLRLIRDVYRLNRETLDKITDKEERVRALVELNVIEQAINLYKTGIVQRKRIESRKALLADPANAKLTNEEIESEVSPRIHAFVFNPSDGILKKLPVNFDQRVGSLDHIYSLYGDK